MKRIFFPCNIKQMRLSLRLMTDIKYKNCVQKNFMFFSPMYALWRLNILGSGNRIVYVKIFFPICYLKLYKHAIFNYTTFLKKSIVQIVEMLRHPSLSVYFASQICNRGKMNKSKRIENLS